MFQISYIFSVAYVITKNPSKSEAFCNILKQAASYSEEFLAPCPTPKLEDHTLLVAHNCLFNIFTASLHIWRPSPPSATTGCTNGKTKKATHIACLMLLKEHNQTKATHIACLMLLTEYNQTNSK
jgi:hypothetical protein